MSGKVGNTNWVICLSGKGKQGGRRGHFSKNSIGQIIAEKGEYCDVWLIGTNEKWSMEKADIKPADLTKTGDTYTHKVCNRCHVLLPISKFEINKPKTDGTKVRRPSCHDCRAHIDIKPVKSKAAKKVAKDRPETGEVFRCPICRKMTIVGVTARIVADHNHRTGKLRGFICDSCNTGLGRFMNGENILKNALQWVEDNDR